MKTAPSPFSARLIRWQRRHGRRDLPWHGTRDAYRIWVSEIMLQQTQVAATIPYYERFVARFADVAALARASEDEVLRLWSGLGYYARARNLHRAARLVRARHGGRFPTTFDALLALPGIGRSTAGAIAAFSAGERRAILDGNVKRVIARHAGIGGDPSASAVLRRLWAQAEARLPRSRIEAYTQALMDLGATVCTARQPRCDACPVRADCVARVEERIAELPGHKRRAAAKRRAIAMLVVVSRGEVLLVKRPPSGIWGGLWSLPEAPSGANPAQALRRDFGLAATRVEKLEPFEHKFTHFTLAVTPWRIQVSSPRRSLPRHALGRGPGSIQWIPAYAGMTNFPVALPAPVRRLLGALRRSASAGAGTCAGSPGARSRRATPGASASRRS